MIIDKINRSNKYNPTHKKMHEMWRSMIGRCSQPMNSSYKDYGAKGVTVCDKWKTYDGFLDDIDSVEGFDLELILKGDLQLDKDFKQVGKDYSEKTYSLDTCSFVSRSENSGMRNNNREFIAIHLTEGIVLSIINRGNFCDEYKLDSSTVFRILKNNNNESEKYTNKRGKFHKGWTFVYKEDFDVSKIPVMNKYIFTNISSNEMYYSYNLNSFCKEKGISSQGASQVIMGKQNKFSGNWTVKKEILDYKSATTIERQLEQLKLL